METYEQGPTRLAGDSRRVSIAARRDRNNGSGETSLRADQLARGLGWFSIGLGAAELLAPRTVAKIAGLDPENNSSLIRLFGLRELASGLAIFMQGDRPAEAVWSRVAGDALDLASLGMAFASPNSQKPKLGFATANVLALTALDVLCAQELSRKDGSTAGGASTRKSLIISRSPEELYQEWRNVEQLPRFDACIDAVGLEAHGAHGFIYAYDRVKQAVMAETDRPIALREAIMACRNGGVVSVIGVYGGLIDKFPMGSFMNRSLTMRTGQCHVQHYWKGLLDRIERGEIDPSFVITHRLELGQAPEGYDTFLNKEGDCIKVVLKPD
jgi:hypothetical protein